MEESLSAIPNDTSELVRLFSTLSLSCWTSSREAVNTKCKVIGLIRFEIKPEPIAAKAEDTLTTRPSELLKSRYISLMYATIKWEQLLSSTKKIENDNKPTARRAL